MSLGLKARVPLQRIKRPAGEDHAPANSVPGDGLSVLDERGQRTTGG